MKTRSLLYTFTITNSSSLSPQQLMEEARIAATRRADIAGWSEIEVQPVATKDAVFEIYGVAASDAGSDNHRSGSKPGSSPSGIAAKDTSI